MSNCFGNLENHNPILRQLRFGILHYFLKIQRHPGRKRPQLWTWFVKAGLDTLLETDCEQSSETYSRTRLSCSFKKSKKPLNFNFVMTPSAAMLDLMQKKQNHPKAHSYSNIWWNIKGFAGNLRKWHNIWPLRSKKMLTLSKDVM